MFLFDETKQSPQSDPGGASYIYGTVAELKALLSGGWKDVRMPFSADELDAHLARVRIIRHPDGADSFELELLGTKGRSLGNTLQASKEKVDFGSVNVFQVMEASVVLSNTGSETIEIVSVSKSGKDAESFSFSGVGTPFNVLPGLMVQMKLHFMPRWAGEFSAAINIETQGNHPVNHDILLSGVGVGESTSLESVDDPAGQSGPVLSLQPNPVREGETVNCEFRGSESLQVGIVIFDAYSRELYAKYRCELKPGVNPLPVDFQFTGGKYFIRFLLPHTQRILSLVVEEKKKRRRRTRKKNI